MKYGYVRSLMKDTRLSPEKLGRRMCVSGMTLRRWMSEHRNGRLPPLYKDAFIEVVSELVAEGLLPVNSRTVKAVTAQLRVGGREEAARRLGVPEELFSGDGSDQVKMTEILAAIGASNVRRRAVGRNMRALRSNRRLGPEWARRIDLLMSVLHSFEMVDRDKYVAYGALFYVLNPFGLIPDHVAVFGRLDDFFILGLALDYYRGRFPRRPSSAQKEA